MNKNTESVQRRLENLLGGERPLLLEFYASWCPHCQRMMPIVERLRRLHGDEVEIVQIDGDMYPDVMADYEADSFPTWIFFIDGREVTRDSGEKSLEELEEIVSR
jgi:thioredoxin 1